VANAIWELTCPNCRDKLGGLRAGLTQLGCASCGEVYSCTEGIWRLLPRERKQIFDRFLRDYTKIRLAEGRGSENPEFYRRLPDCDPSHPLAWQWRIHQRTLRSLTHRILPQLGTNLKVLDLGAGVGWLSHQLSRRGHHPCAIDITVDEQDGLGAARHYAPDWPRIQTDFDHLPIDENSVDCVIYNASLHYSTDYAITLAEAQRVLRTNGHIVVLESPIYKHEESGRKMAAERHAGFERRFGTRSDSIRSMEYLTWDMLEHLARKLNLTWRIAYPWYGVRWAMRPWVAWLKRGREPSQFPILVGQGVGVISGFSQRVPRP
jgi:ubiquinone/menaquinone biosynthesis C-methylase UbiE/uncharacterized protein YbaR (Trm112 family)